jgi:hypothetical protein
MFQTDLAFEFKFKTKFIFLEEIEPSPFIVGADIALTSWRRMLKVIMLPSRR